jgi:hypothetical protein
LKCYVFSAGNINYFGKFFAAMNFKKIRDDYSGKLAKMLEKLQSGFSYFEIS